MYTFGATRALGIALNNTIGKQSIQNSNELTETGIISQPANKQRAYGLAAGLGCFVMGLVAMIEAPFVPLELIADGIVANKARKA